MITNISHTEITSNDNSLFSDATISLVESDDKAVTFDNAAVHQTYTKYVTATHTMPFPNSELDTNLGSTPISNVTSPNDNFQETLESLIDYQASLIVWRYCPLLLLPLGTVGNVMVIWVLSHFAHNGGNPAIFVYFRALAVSDLCLLYSGLLRNWIKYFFRLEIRDIHGTICKIHIWLVYVSGIASAWFLVAVTSQRALSIVWPHKMPGVMRSRKTAWLIIVIIVALSCLLNAHSLYGYDLRYNDENGQFYCDYTNPGYENFARGAWPWLDLSLSSILPFAILIANNTLLMWKVASSVRSIRNLSATAVSQGSAVSQRKKMSTSLNLTLICLSVTFLLLTSPICVLLVLDQYLRYDLADNPELTAATNLAWAVTNNLWYANSTINFYLYCLSGSKFRQQVWQCLNCFNYSARKTNTALAFTTVSAAEPVAKPSDDDLEETHI